VFRWLKLLVFAAGLSALAAAADRDMLNLVMPDASMVMEVNIARIMASPVGSAMRDAVQQGIAARLKGELAKGKPELQEKIAILTQIDWSKDVQDVLIAGGTGKSAPALLIVRTGLDAARLQALKAFTGAATEYQGVTMLVSDQPGNGAIAFLDNSIAVLGQVADVQAAVRRRGQHTALSPSLAAQVAKYGGYDLWVAATGIPAAPTGSPAAASAPGAQAAAQLLAKVAGFHGGLRFSPDFDLSADIEARTEKNATEMAQGLRMLTSMVQAQAKSAGKGASGLDSLKFQVSGRHILLGLHVPEEQMRAGLEQMRAAQAAAAQQMPPAPPANGLPAVPPGTIRVQSSEGTVLIPIDKDH